MRCSGLPLTVTVKAIARGKAFASVAVQSPRHCPLSSRYSAVAVTTSSSIVAASAGAAPSSIGQLSAALARLLAVGGETAGGLLGALNRPGKPKTGTGKRWVRPEDTQAKPEDGSTTPADTEATSPPATVVSSFEEIDALIEAAASGQAG